MDENNGPPAAELYVTQGCLVVPIQVEPDDASMQLLQRQILERISSAGIKAGIIDVSGVAVIDSFLGQSIFDTAKMAALLGARVFITGIKPGVAASLTDLNFEPAGVSTAVSLEAGLRILTPGITVNEEREEATESENDDEYPEEDEEENPETGQEEIILDEAGLPEDNEVNGF
jgi:rsbT antagonist protein RsbS